MRSRQSSALVTPFRHRYFSGVIEERTILPDTLGNRKRIGLVVPSTNTTVQPETDMLRVPGVQRAAMYSRREPTRFDGLVIRELPTE